MVDFSGLPGSELVREGLDDLRDGRHTLAALLVSIGAPRLRMLGVDVPTEIPNAEHRLYLALSERHGDAAHSRYNALIRRLVSFQRTLACAS